MHPDNESFSVEGRHPRRMTHAERTAEWYYVNILRHSAGVRPIMIDVARDARKVFSYLFTPDVRLTPIQQDLVNVVRDIEQRFPDEFPKQ